MRTKKKNMIYLQKKVRQKIPLLWLKKISELTLDKLNKDNCAITIVICSERFIRKYNRIYANKDKPTDVLAFQFERHRGFQAEAETYLGDILICYSVAKNVSKKLNIPLKKEISRYIVHGILHLIGFSDKNNILKKRMKLVENNLLKQVWNKKGL
jgi:probable rRNA maturation factor